MDWTWVVDEHDVDEHGNWAPRVIWGDGMVTVSGSRIHSSRTLAEAKAEVGQWNWWQGRSAQDTQAVLDRAAQHNKSLTEDGYWKGELA